MMSEELIRIKREHLASIAQLEAKCFAEPWSEGGLSIYLGEQAVGYVLLLDGEAVAYGGMITVLDEGQIADIATHPEYRRRGYGARVLDALESHAVQAGLCTLSLEVRVSNEAARALYASHGWEEAGVRRGFYSHPREDAIIMIKRLS